jgi:hypothetical protein
MPANPPEDPRRPDRVELFAFYFLGFSPEGTYRFANAHHVARHYRVSADAVLRWLVELKLDPHEILHRQFDLAGAQVELQLDAPALTPEGVRLRAAEILRELESAPGGRRPWEENG